MSMHVDDRCIRVSEYFSCSQARSMFDSIPEPNVSAETLEARARIQSTMKSISGSGASGATRAKKDIEGVGTPCEFTP
jgi:hypothetical protein